MRQVLLIVGNRDPVLADYATYCARGGRAVAVVSAAELHAKIKGAPALHRIENFTAARFLATDSASRVQSVVLFLEPASTATNRALMDAVTEIVRAKRIGCLCVISTFGVHLGDRMAARAETELLRRFRDIPVRIVVLRPSHVLSPNSRLRTLLRSSWYWYPIVPSSIHGCCIECSELFPIIDRELSDSTSRSPRTFTLLGTNESWQSRLHHSRTGPVARSYAYFISMWVAATLIRLVIGFLIQVIGVRMRRLQPWHTTTLRPTSIQELLTLYNPHNYRHVKVVGYNNGVVHFGQRYPSRTVVSTVACGRRARIHGDVATFDAGVTVRQALDVLRPAGREFYVLPNYSYVSVGTSYFIPIHGSSTKFNTMGETIEKVLLYDPVKDKFLAAKRDDPEFGAGMYNLAADRLLLRLRIKTREKCRYYVEQLEKANLSGPDILNYFHDTQSANVEVRKAGSHAGTIQIYQYSTERADGASAQEVPRDAIGRVWDRLEENPIASPLFHGLTRWLAYHVELFLTETEFAAFWETHRLLPILKIQLRYIRRDGLPNSPFRDQDRVSADLFMLKKHREKFDRYLREVLPEAKMNPGKHSM